MLYTRDTPIVVRRAALQALQDVVRLHGISPDLIVLPMADDHQRMLYVSDTEVRWLHNMSDSRVRATILFETDMTGIVVGSDIHHVIENTDNFDLVSFGFDSRDPSFCWDFDETVQNSVST